MQIQYIKIGKNPDAINAIIEIPYGSHVKYEVDKDSGAVVVDRVLYPSMVYPANYGFVPHTLGGDGDPADILVLNEDPLQAGSVIKCRLIGVLFMEDEGGVDEKLLALPVEKIDPRYAKIQSLEDLPPITLEKIKHFFETYKDLEKDKWVKVKGFGNKAQAQEVLEQAIDHCQKSKK
ncbi:inorganic diphosphatase [Helicobacter salomonis]|uniref:inorganic diphosphatase n=1 Tax=Helicobacter salomonis TaxID=56878 RepID=UPI000CF0236F|nr:inorganic diphosphatase [Helicobacter salomonis]